MNFISSETAASISTERIEQIEVVALDEYCRQQRIPKIDLMKIDIEGGEFDAMLGAEQLLRQQAIACIVIELVDWPAQRAGHTTREIKALLTDHQYRLYDLVCGQLMPLDLDLPNSSANIVALPGHIYHD